MKFKNFIFFILNLLIIGCDGSYDSNNDELITDFKSTTRKFVTVGYSGTILTSTDGTSWTSKTSGTSSTLWGITYSNGI